MTDPASTPEQPHDVRAFGSDAARIDEPEARLIRAETLLSVAMDRVHQLERRQGKQEATVARIETRMSHMECKLDQVVQRLSQIPTTARHAAVVTGATGGVATVVLIVQQVLAALGHGG